MTSGARFIDLFSGCGGLSLGLTQAGLQGLFAIERDAMAFRTFEANFLEPTPCLRRFDWPRWLEKSAWPIDDLLREHAEDLVRLRGDVEVIVGGPPCQGFSFAGRRNADDPRNALFKQYVKVVDAVRPWLVLLENVPGMKVPHAATSFIPSKRPARSYFEKLCQKLVALDYDVHGELVDPIQFGIPQRRKRLIVFGVRRDVAQAIPRGAKRVFELLEQARIEQLEELGLSAPVTARQAISDLETANRRLEDCKDPDSPRGFKEVSYGGPRTAYQRLMNDGHADQPMNSMRLARHRDDVRDRFAKILEECQRGVRMNDAARARFSLLKHRVFPMAHDEPAPTITTLPDDVLHYCEPRILTVRECARLQSFPDWFEFRGKFTTGGDRRKRECPRYTQVGNAVPPLLARAIGGALLSALAEAGEGLAAFAARNHRAKVAVPA